MRIEHPPISQFVSLESHKNLLEKASGLQGGRGKMNGTWRRRALALVFRD